VLMTEDRLISILAGSYFWPGAEYEDVAQEARYALEKARGRWNPEKGCPWLSFAWVCVKRHLIEQVRRETKRRPQFAYLSERHPARGSVHELAEAREQLRTIVEAPLTDMERFVVGRALRGETLTDEKWMDNALWRARRKLAA
jgi:DNA-directed RNA polymerase specialized sigma24 family protein